MPLQLWYKVLATWIAGASDTSLPRQTLVSLCHPLSPSSSCLPLSTEDSLGPGLITADLTNRSEGCLPASILSEVVHLLSSLLSSVTDALISYANLHYDNSDINWAKEEREERRTCLNYCSCHICWGWNLDAQMHLIKWKRPLLPKLNTYNFLDRMVYLWVTCSSKSDKTLLSMFTEVTAMYQMVGHNR